MYLQFNFTKMMKKKLNIFSIIIMFLIIISCTKEVNNNISTQQTPISNDRLVFQSPKDFYNTYAILSKFKTEDELRFWAQSKTHTTLLDSQDSIISNYSGVLRTILNKDSEFEMGDSIILFNNGDLYGYSKNELNISIQKNPEKFKKVGSAVVSIVQRENSKSDIGPFGLDATLQQEFNLHTYFPCGGTQQTGLNALRKFVSELYYEQISFFPSPWNAILWLRIKLEEKASNKWRQCSNLRDVSFDISGNATLFIDGVPQRTQDYHIMDNFQCSDNTSVSGPINVLMTFWSYPTYDVSSFWRVHGYGSITQHIQGDDNYITHSAGTPYGLWN